MQRTKGTRRVHDPLFLSIRNPTGATTPQLILTGIKSTIAIAHRVDELAAHGCRPNNAEEGHRSDSPSSASTTRRLRSSCLVFASSVGRVSSGSSKQAEQQRGVPVPPVGGSQLCVAGPSSSPPRVLRLTDPPYLHRPAHEPRALSAPMALLRGVPLGELISAVEWASGSTFAQFYLRLLGLSEKDVLPSSLRLPATL